MKGISTFDRAVSGLMRIEAALVVDVMRERDGAALEETARSAVRQCIQTGPGKASIHAGTYLLLGVWRAYDIYS